MIKLAKNISVVVARHLRPSHLDKMSRMGRLARLRHLLKQLQITTVIDAGANTGQFASQLRSIGYKGQIISFEPNPIDHAILQSAFKADRSFRSHQCGLGDTECALRLNTSQRSVFNSFCEFLDENTFSDSVIVPVKRLDMIADVADSKGNLFLKMDTQGFDVKVFEGARNLYPRIAGLMSELSVSPLYKNAPSYFESLTHFESEGFQLVDLFLVSRTIQGTIEEYDCLMVNKIFL